MGRPKDSAEQRPKEPVEPNSSRNYAKLGKCTMIRFTANRAASRKVDLFINKANSYGLLAPAPSTMTIQPQLSLELPYQDLIPNLAFDVRYLLEAALSFNYILVSDITPKFASILCSMDPSKAATILEQAVGSRSRIWNPTEHLIAKENKLSRTRMRTTRTIPPQCVYLRKVIVTPTTMYLHPPTVETSNRVIRQYSDLSDYFLRVEFADEGLSKLWSKGQTGYALFTRIFSILDQGIKIGNRTYEFLAFSSSQLRENAVWLFCRKQGSQVTADSIRRWMGDFSHIKSAAKYSARMGQCFSSTREIAHLTSSEVELVNDIENKKYVFSDGCGKLSAALAEKISVELEKMVPPSAFQIRLGGAKGVLAVSPDLKGNHVQIRPSMKKFDVDFHVLEVIKVSAYAPCFLNRQIIILITALGVPDKVIWGLKDKMIQELEEIETDDDTAIRMLYHNWDEGGPTEMMMKLIKAGFLKNGDPFIKNLLTLFKLQLLEELPRRARIFVPDGAFLLGVVDETAQLQEGEIFVQISSAEDPTRRRVVTGKCAVVRSPCFHPGDVRLVTAVDCPALRHLHDVVVFNTKGPRSLPSMCSGGDLDGDGKRYFAE
ncbi:hypothetical protein BGW38_004353 [Lunasporangiospora selenospora]|uniref:RNA-dependent RNA polymerase n=1 Tax=Lunasporangiospora selenospora TaxID=979761 RepID=A0A9P6FPU5_9FUNG|nr:hypothetical protein BGW38_004353 [Lunasporangiospora selenospora]